MKTTGLRHITQMGYSDFIIFADESGDTGVKQISPDYPVFLLNCCIFRRDEYVKIAEPALRAFKVAYFGHNRVVLHWNKVRNQIPPFDFGGDVKKQMDFRLALDRTISAMDFTIVAAVIAKNRLRLLPAPPPDLYALALSLCMQQSDNFLSGAGQSDRTTCIVIESRNKSENRTLNRAFASIKTGSGRAAPLSNFKLEFAPKQQNDAGLQIADRLAHPIARYCIAPLQSNWAWTNLVAPKLYRNAQGATDGAGLIRFP